MATTIRFTQDQIEQLRAAQRALNDAMPLMDAAEAAGIDCSGHRQLVSTLKSVLDNLDAHFVRPSIREQSRQPVGGSSDGGTG